MVGLYILKLLEMLLIRTSKGENDYLLFLCFFALLTDGGDGVIWFGVGDLGDFFECVCFYGVCYV